MNRLSYIHEKEAQRVSLASWYITVPGISEDEKKKIEKSLHYNLKSSLMRFTIALFVLMMIWAFGFMMHFDPYESATGYELIGRKNVTAVVQEDGVTVTLKDPNKGEHVVYTLTDLGLDAAGYSYGDRIDTYWQWEKDSGDYTYLTALPAARASQLENAYNAISLLSLFGIIIGCSAVFVIRRRIYTGWYTVFYYRMEKFCSEYGVCWRYPGCDVTEAFVAYGKEYPWQFVAEFNAIQLTAEEIRKKRRAVITAMLLSLAVAAAIIAGIAFCTAMQAGRESTENEARTSAAAGQAQAAGEGELAALGESSDYYNMADMMERARTTFPGEDVYYKIITTEDYIAVVVTTAQKKNVYFDRYIPVEGAVGDADTVYRLEISMASDAIQPDEILQNHTGILYAQANP